MGGAELVFTTDDVVVLESGLEQTNSIGIPFGNRMGIKSFPIMNWYSSTSRSKISKICGDRAGACRMTSRTMTGIAVMGDVRPSEGWEME